MTAPLQPFSDAVLVERMMQGDENALSTLYDRYSGMLYAILLRILKDAHAAEEILQDLFLQLWRNPGQFDANRGSLPAWLIVIGRNRAISRLRRRDRRVVVEDGEEFAIESLPSGDNLEEEASRAELRERLCGAMATLPPQQREVLELAYFEGMTQTEIASRTASPLGTVKSRARAAMQSLQQILDDGKTRQSGRS